MPLTTLCAQPHVDYAHFKVVGVQDASGARRYSTHTVCHTAPILIFATCTHLSNAQHKKQSCLHTSCSSVHTGLTLCTHLTQSRSCGRGCAGCPLVLRFLPSGQYSARWHSPYVCTVRICRGKHPTFCTNHPTIVGRTPALLLTLTFPAVSRPGGYVFTTNTPPPAPTEAPKPGGFLFCPAPMLVWGPPALPCVAFGRRPGRGSRERGRGRRGPAVMQSRGGGGRGGCPRGGWSAAAPAPARAAGPGTIRAGSGSLLGLRRALGPGGFT